MPKVKKLQVIGKFPSGEIDPSKVQEIVNDYLTENPPTTPSFTINGQLPDENGNYAINSIVDITITSDDEPYNPGGPGDFDVINTSDNSSPIVVLF